MVGAGLFAPATAKFATRATRQVPIVRLLKNLELKRGELGMSSTDKALVDFHIGRLHAMAYALKVEQAATDAQAYPNSRFELPDFGDEPDHLQFEVTPTKDPKKRAAAMAHLKLAIEHLQKATRTDPQFLPAFLGLAWCLDQSGQSDKALPQYRKVFKEAYDAERTAAGGMVNWSMAVETAEYLTAILDPVKNAKELSDIKAKTAELEKLPRYVTPVVIPLRDNLPFEQVLVDHPVRFDLDGRGKHVYRNWISPDTGWLVFDAEQQGQIDSGLQLIGSATFWLFWRNGYEVLHTLDNNGDGWLVGDELEHLAIWQDANTNGVSESGEVKGLDHWGIEALSTQAQRHCDNVLVSPDGLRLNSGASRPTWDVVLHADH